MMAVLDNPRQERFAQGLARGLDHTEAYVEAGYRRSTSAASRLAKDPAVKARAAELMDRAAERTEIDVALVTANLIRIAGKAEEAGGAPGLGVARAAWMDAAKLNRLMSERSEPAHKGQVLVLSAEPMTEEEWEAKYGPGGTEALCGGAGQSGEAHAVPVHEVERS
jgi:phage terminase small subunit